MNPHLRPWAISPDDFPADSCTSDQLEYLLGYAILAPSIHNTQPWLFRINPLDVEVFRDQRRTMPSADPEQREMTLSCGAAVENLCVAAEYFGHQYRVDLAPDPGEANLLARVRLGLSSDTSAEDVLLFHALTERHMNREPFAERALPEELLTELAGAATGHEAWLVFIEEEEARKAVSNLVARADEQQWADKSFRAELSSWTRNHPATDADGIPATELGIKDWFASAAPILVRAFDRGHSMAMRDHDVAAHSPVLAVLGTESDSIEDWMRAGRAIERVLLRARSEDVWASLLNAPIEVRELRQDLAAVVGRNDFPQVLFRLGYSDHLPEPSPRRAVHDVTIQHPR